MESPLISVIIPVYNVAPFLRDCVQSVLSQTYQALEIILVDDGSTDASPSICDELAAADSRVRVIHKQNGGLSSARNAGLEIMRGEYLAFIDSDDCIAADMLETMLRAAELHDADLVKCNFQRFADTIPSADLAEDTGTVRVFTTREAVYSFLSEPYSLRKCFLVSACNALYRTQAVRALRFPEGLLYEDGYYSPQAFLVSKTLVHMDRSMYYYRINPNSIMSRTITEHALKSIDDWEFIYLKIQEQFPDLAKLAIPRWIAKLLTTYDYLIGQDKIDQNGACRAHILSKVQENRALFLANANDTQKRKIRLLCRNAERYNHITLHGSLTERTISKAKALFHH